MEQVKISVSQPFELDYRTSSKVLILTGVEATGRAFEVQFSSDQTRALCELLGESIQLNQGFLGSTSESVNKH